MQRNIKGAHALVCALTVLIGATGCAPTQHEQVIASTKPEQVLMPPGLVLQITVDQLRGDLPVAPRRPCKSGRINSFRCVFR